MQLISALIAAAVGVVSGLFLPYFSQRLSVYKCNQKKRELKEDPRFTNWMAKVPCALANGANFGLCWYFGSHTPVAAILAAIIWALGILLIIVDLRLRLIPNEVLLWMLIFGVVMQVILRGFGVLPSNIFISFFAFGLFTMLGSFMGLYKIGAGDVKLAMVMVMSLGAPAIYTTILGFSASLMLFCLIGLLLKKMTLKSYLPLGPFMVPGFWVGLIVLLNAAV